MSYRIRLVVVDDHALFRSGLISLLSETNDFEVVGQASEGSQALAVVEQTHPDVVLLDVNMPGMGGVETVINLRKKNGPKIIMLTISKNDEDLFGAITAGADGYLLKNASPEELIGAIRKVRQGMAVLSADVTKKVLQAVNIDQSKVPMSGLSSREMEVLKRLAGGMTTAQISKDMFISDNTVKTHVRHILEKLEASNRAEAVSKATQLGLLKGI
ncbi:MAG: response regulator transcription factor [Anaerolineales bacterium]|nr:response regulator transcription factor [Anaerolineales bacterium]